MIRLKHLSALAFAMVWMGAFGQISWQTMADSDSFRVVRGVGFGASNRGYVLTGDTGRIGFVKFWDHVWQYDPASNSWARKGNFPGKPRVAASSFVINNKGYVCLGINDSIIWDSIFFIGPGGPVYRNIPIKVWKGAPMNDLWEYDPATDTWTKRADFPGDPRSAASAFVVNNKAYVGLGITQSGSMKKDFYEYDPATNTWRRVADFGGKERSNASAFAGINTTTSTPVPLGFVGSGRDSIPNTYFNDWYRYNPANNTWTRVRDLPAERPQQDAAAFGYGYLGYLTTGFNWFFHRLTWQYNINSNTWISENPFPQPAWVRSSTVWWQLNNRCFVGAGNADTVPSFKDYRRFNIDTSDMRITQYPDSVCTGSNFQVRFKSTQSTYISGNTFRVQLSNRFGEFDNTLPSSTIIGSITSIADSGLINCFIDPNLNPRITFTDTNDYRIRIISSSPFKFGSASDTLIVLPKVYVDGVTLLSGDTACTGSDALMRVNGTWSGESSRFKIQWRRNGVALVTDSVKIFGANDTVLRITNIATSDQGNYSVIVTGDCSGDTSENVRLNVISIGRPTITQQPLNTITCEAGSATFNTNATGRSLNFQWFRATTRDSAGNWEYDTLRSTFFISGVNSNILRISSTLIGDTGRYFVKVFENCGAYRYSDTVSLTFSRNVQVYSMFPRDTFVLENNPVTFKVFSYGDSLKYRWKFEDNYLQDGGRVSGSQTNTLTITNINFQDLGFYSCEIEGLCGDTLSPLALLDIGVVPKFRAHPRDTTVLCDGEFLELSVIADGVNLGYQWLKNGVPVINGGSISGATERVLRINPARPADAGAYRCEVFAGTAVKVTSNIGQVIVHAIPGKPSINQLGTTILEATIPNGQIYQWFLNNIFQPQFTTQQIVTSAEGEYKVRIINNNCVGAFSDPFLFVNTSVKIPADVANITVYPNPNNGQFTIDIEQNQSGSKINFELRDLRGRMVMQAKDLLPGKNIINATEIAQGLYIGRVMIDNASYDVKLRIQ